MSTIRRCGVVSVTFLAAIQFLGYIRAQSNSPQEDQMSIARLIQAVNTAATKGSNLSPFLSPNCNGAERTRELEIATKPYTHFAISGFLLPRDIVIHDGTHATLRAVVSWATPHLSATNDVEISFQKVSGKWYCANFDFLKFNWFLTLAMSALGVAYAVIALAFFAHVRRHSFASFRSKALWRGLVFTPVGWILYPVIKPWRRTSG